MATSKIKKDDSKIISKDEQWLKDLAAQNSFYAQQSGVQQALAEESKTADEQLQEETLVPPPPPKSKVDMRVADREAAKLDKLHKRAEKLDAADRERTTKEEEARVEAEFKAQQEKDRERAQHIGESLGQGVTAIGNQVRPLVDKAATLPTPGGIGLLLVVLTILVFTVVVVNANGDTRIKQLWYMLRGETTLQGAVTPVPPITAPQPTGTSTGIPSIPGFPGIPGTGGIPPLSLPGITSSSDYRQSTNTGF